MNPDDNGCIGGDAAGLSSSELCDRGGDCPVVDAGEVYIETGRDGALYPSAG